MNDSTLRKLQLTQLEILKDIDRFCKENNIQYSLYGGTLIGAVRHKGFIPWDDDLDIAMNRENYKKFIKCWKNKPISGYFFQDYNTDSKFNYTFGKIRKNNTKYESNKKTCHDGIFIDIFPLDRYPKGSLSRKKHFIYNCLHLLFSRGYPNKNDGKLLYFISKVLLNITPKKYKHRIKLYSSKKVIKYNKYNDLSYTDNSLFSGLKLEFPCNLFDEIINIEFEDVKFPAFKLYDSYLKIQYGDYMTFPPLDQRVCKHNPKKILFNMEGIPSEES